MMQHLKKFSTATTDTTRKDLENTLLKLEGKMSKQMSVSRSHKSPNKVVKLGMFTILYSIFSLCACYYCGVSIHSFQKETTGKNLMRAVEKEIQLLNELNVRLDMFFTITSNRQLTEKGLAEILKVLSDLYKFHLGHNLDSNTLLSMLRLGDDQIKIFNYKDTKFVFESFFLVIDKLSDYIITKLASDNSVRNEHPLVRVTKAVRASALLEKCQYLHLMRCNFYNQSNDHNLIPTYLNYAKGHLKSIFMEDFVRNVTVVIKEIDKYFRNFPTYDQEFVASNGSCVTLAGSHISTNLSFIMLHFGQNIVRQQIQERDLHVQKARNDLTGSIIILVGTSVVCALLVASYKCKLEQLNDLTFCDNLLEKENKSEKDFYSETVSDVFPKQLITTSFKATKAKHTEHTKNDSDDDTDDVFRKLSHCANNSFSPRMKTPIRYNNRFKKRHRSILKTRVSPTISSNGFIRNEPYIRELTLMMIDVVNFNRLLDYLSPSEVVNVMTYVSRLLDDRASYYDVFVTSKGTETFTVVSGFTDEQWTYHATQVANMALDVSVSCSDIELDNVPDSKLRLRIGIHTDSCYATVVGTQHHRPRFRIYGEILKTVRAMQKMSFPNKIQISDNTYKLLTDHIYNIQKRGYIDLKNGMKIFTHWLLGKRVSIVSMAPDVSFRNTSIHPIELEQKPLYEFDAEEGMPPAWTHAHLFQPDDPTLPHCSFHRPSEYSSPQQRYRSQVVLTEETEM